LCRAGQKTLTQSKAKKINKTITITVFIFISHLTGEAGVVSSTLGFCPPFVPEENLWR